MNNNKFKKILTIAVSFTFGVVSTLIGVKIVNDISGVWLSDEVKLNTLINEIDENYLWDIDKEEWMESIYRYAVETLGDPYSEYLTKEEYDEIMSSLSGEFTGIGILFQVTEEDEFLITHVFEESPAKRGGLEAGDIIIAVDGVEYETSDEVADATTGEEGTDVTITYIRNGAENHTTMTRSKIELPSVHASMLEDNIGYIQITSFDINTAELFKTELDNMEKNNVDGVVIDLRNNPGGYADQALYVADMLIGASNITTMVDNAGNSEAYNSDESKTKLNYTLLVNENSASASEIVAAAVLENHGNVVGTVTFGKGIAQDFIMLPDGSSLKITVSQFLTPSLKEIHNVGVTPDYIVEDYTNGDVDRQLNKAVEILLDQQ